MSKPLPKSSTTTNTFTPTSDPNTISISVPSITVQPGTTYTVQVQNNNSNQPLTYKWNHPHYVDTPPSPIDLEVIHRLVEFMVAWNNDGNMRDLEGLEYDIATLLKVERDPDTGRFDWYKFLESLPDIKDRSSGDQNPTLTWQPHPVSLRTNKKNPP